MQILFIIGSCLYQNTSANLCHKAYIDGFVKLGHNVDLLTFSEKDVIIDKSIKLPKVRNHYKYDGVSLYEKLAVKNTSSHNNKESSTYSDETPDRISFKHNIISKIKKVARSSYGIYNPTIVWYRRAKRFNTNIEYDLVISLSYPQVSHLLANYLKKKNRVKAKRWIQLWEDPWSIDLNNSDSYKKSLKAEKKLLDSAQEIIYVSPITLNRQKGLFPNSSDKMKWCPLPNYYVRKGSYRSIEGFHYGYFGDYSPSIRNLIPFYNVAVKKNLYFDICGSPYGILKSQANVTVNPRIPLDKLQDHENNANVLVCLFNKYGGQIPGKVYQYAATDKIIIAILDGTDEEKRVLRDFFEPLNRFIFCENNELSISKAIEIVQSGDFGDISNNPIFDFSVKKISKMIIMD